MRFFIALLLLATAVSAQPVSLFDGKSLDGWEFDPQMWRVEGGVVTGGSRTEKINSGIQIRSQRRGHAMSGYQIDCGAGWFGKIYDEHRRNKPISVPTLSDQRESRFVVKVPLSFALS
jgi:hypothetical protein